jgi:hypothetical protein
VVFTCLQALATEAGKLALMHASKHNFISN